MTTKVKEAGKMVSSGVVGAGLGYGVVAASGLTAVGAIGGGAGVGSALGPVGAAIGGVFGLAAFGVWRVFRPIVHEVDRMASKRPEMEGNMSRETLDPNNEAHEFSGGRFSKPMPNASNYELFEMDELYGIDDQAYLMAQIDRNWDLE